MSTARLTFLYPHLYRSIRLAESTAQTTKHRCRKPSDEQRRQYATAFSATARGMQASFERHGKAVEPMPAPPDDVKLPQASGSNKEAIPQPPPKSKAPSSSAASTGIGEKYEARGAAEPNKGKPAAKEAATTAKSAEASSRPATKADESSSSSSTTVGPSPPGQAGSQAEQTAAEEQMRRSGPMDVVLHMPPPGSAPHAHITTPRYTHHFDTYTLVKQLEQSGYSNEQAITLMKAVRVMLAQNLDVAQDGLVSKRDVDNVGGSHSPTLTRRQPSGWVSDFFSSCHDYRKRTSSTPPAPS